MSSKSTRLSTYNTRTHISDILKYEPNENDLYTVCGWSKTLRKQGAGKFCFLALNDGSTTSNLQVVIHNTLPNFEEISKNGGVGSSIKAVGSLVASPADGQPVELLCSDPEKHNVHIYCSADSSKYPLAKKKHSKEYLREIAHFRPRSYLFAAVSRIRSQLAMAIHTYFQQKNFLYVHTPIITASDCEGAGELFSVSSILPPADKPHDIPLNKDGSIDYTKDFFNKPAYLTVSGQLNVETFCCALSDCYTFGPAFRAENSHTSRHLAEFWMIEPELAFADIFDLMDCAEDLIKFCVNWVLEKCLTDLQWIDQHSESGLLKYLNQIASSSTPQITYTDAIEMLKPYNDQFKEEVYWGIDLSSEHERFLCEKLFNSPIAVYNYPKEIKSFYMRQNDDGTVAAMDVLYPGIGELVGGSQREERLEYLDNAISEKKLNINDYSWYRDIRKYGSVPHSGFGLGFERLVMFITGTDNIRDVIPFPRHPGHAEF